MAYIVVMVKGTVHSIPDVRRTLELLHLTRVNHAVIIPKNSYYKGMLQVVKDYVTWGELNEETAVMLLKDRAMIEGNKKMTEEYLSSNTSYKSFEALAKDLVNEKYLYKQVPAIKPLFRLPPPLKGYRSVKRVVKDGGSLGYRGEKINELVRRMITGGEVNAKQNV